MSTYRTCRDCPRQLRPMDTQEDAHPGTYSNHGRGLCKRCYEVRKSNGTLTDLPIQNKPISTHCAGPCGRPLRKRGALLADYPGTVAHVAHSMCATCTRHLSDTNATNPSEDPEERKRIEKLRREQVAFHRAFRKRNGLDHTGPIDLRQLAMAA